MLTENLTIVASLDLHGENLSIFWQYNNSIGLPFKDTFRDKELLSGDYWDTIYFDGLPYDINLYDTEAYSLEDEGEWKLCLYPVFENQRQDHIIISIPLFVVPPYTRE
jgi:hypothetical protein